VGGYFRFTGQNGYLHAFYWTQAGGLVDLGTLGGQYSEAFAVSADGSVIVGNATDSQGQWKAFRWTQSEGMVSLGTLPGGTYSDAYGVSSNGSVITGTSEDSEGNYQAYRWTKATGMVKLGVLPGHNSSYADGLSSDGSVIVGSSEDSDYNSRAFRWTQAGGMVDLGVLAGYQGVSAYNVSPDGSAVVGVLDDGAMSLRAFRWTQSGGMIDMGTFAGGDFSIAFGVSTGGSVIVGYSNDGAGNQVGFRWTQATGMQTINKWLEDNGVSSASVQFSNAGAVSPDGKVVVGQKVKTPMDAAYRARTNFGLTVTKTGTGIVTSSPTGINCGTDCSNAYAANTSVTLTATPGTGYKFSSWSGACSGTSTKCTLSMNASKVAKATFERLRYTLTVNKTGNGTITSNPDGISCGSICSQSFIQNTAVALTATPDSANRFTGWSGACTGTGSCTVTMSANKTVSGTFATCTVGIAPGSANMPDIGGTGSVTVTVSPTTCAWTATSNATWITVTSGGSGAGNRVVGYSVAENTATSSRTGTITIGGKTFTITQQGTPQYLLTVVKDGTGVGTVISRDGKINCGSTCGAVYSARTSVILQPLPLNDAVFTWWKGACSGTENCTLTVSANATATATFDKRWLWLSSPAPGDMTYGNRTTVMGKVTTDSGLDVGVTVNGYPATIYGDQFIVNNVPLVEGANTLTAKAVDAKGRTTSASIGVNAVTTGHYLGITATTETGFPPFEITLKLSGSFSLTQSTLFSNVGADMTVLSSYADEYKVRLNSEGIYYLKVQSTGPDGNVYEAWAVVTALNKAQVDALLKAKW
jgi:probable HAF family extracellular repeat protein